MVLQSEPMMCFCQFGSVERFYKVNRSMCEVNLVQLNGLQSEPMCEVNFNLVQLNGFAK